MGQILIKADLKPLFGEIPDPADNLQIVGAYRRRFEDREWPTVWPSSGVVRWKDGEIENETLWIKESLFASTEAVRSTQLQKLESCGDYQSKWSWFPRRLRGRYFNLSLYWSFGYYHWICDCLARLHGVCERLTPDSRIILPANPKSWQTQSLELLGVPKSQWLVPRGKRPLQVETLFYASPVAMTGDHEMQSLRWVRDTIWHRCLGGIRMPRGQRKVYLQRSNTWSRNIINEDQLLGPLLGLGFEVVDCGKLSFVEQVRLLSEAEIVIGPHGAALTNILWAPSGTKVFEIFEPGAVRRCYWSMCRHLGHQHFCAIAEAVNQAGREANIRVPVDQFISVVKAILN